MLKVNLRDGCTLGYNLTDMAEKVEWERQQESSRFQRSITGIGIHHDQTLHALPIPRKFRRVSFGGEAIVRGDEVVGERIVCQADQVRISLSVYFASGTMPKHVRVDVAHLGQPRFVARHRASPQEVDGRRGGYLTFEVGKK